jgi:hypothetical protein
MNRTWQVVRKLEVERMQIREKRAGEWALSERSNATRRRFGIRRLSVSL